jgi:hypothetical protein
MADASEWLSQATARKKKLVTRTRMLDLRWG